MTDFKIDDDVPLPVKSMYPIQKLEIGQSFFVAGGKPETMANAIAWVRRNIPGRQFTTKTRVEDEIKGVRVWRVK